MAGQPAVRWQIVAHGLTAHRAELDRSGDLGISPPQFDLGAWLPTPSTARLDRSSLVKG